MINPKNKRVQVTLPGETVELLESLSIRYNKSFSEIVKWAINVLGAKKRHNIVIKLSEQQNEENNNITPERKKELLNWMNQTDNNELSPEEEQELINMINER